MARKTDVRSAVTLRSSAGTGTAYRTTKNRRNTPDRLVMRKYDPKVRGVVEFRETR
ncbi:MAG: 50S ribosomal protein L33 [Brachybacterium sp.]|uniref:50S ribosomal protein L33 n=1 Tax=Brachybacterium sp. TaxID=1891286 RepID=UPI002648D494|nr:50S ribosomal protein L33 [Brachybacterium sp.]MDN5687451.1 50S ribosomal protein L33 [Brachybacterium sp.]